MKSLPLIFLTVIINTIGQLAMKKGMSQVGEITFHFKMLMSNFTKAVTTPFVIIGFILYIVSAFFWLIILSRVDLSFAYPLLSIGYILVMLTSIIFLNESFSLVRFIGILIICGGIYLTARS